MRDVFAALHCRNNKTEFVNVMKSDAYRSMWAEDALVLAEFSGVKLPKRTKKGRYDMCRAVEEMQQEAREQGEEIGKEIGEEIGEKRGKEHTVYDFFLGGHISEEIAASALNLTRADFTKKIKKYVSASAGAEKPVAAAN